MTPVDPSGSEVPRPRPRPRPGPGTAPDDAAPPPDDAAAPAGARRPPGARDGGVIGVPGIVLMIAGAVMLLISFSSADWYPGSQEADSVHGIGFADLHHNLDAFDAPVASRAYFSWLAWLLLIALIVVGLVANIPNRRVDGLRMTGFILGLAGAALTYYALSRYVQALTDRGASQGRALDHAQSGIWLALFGFLIAGIGAAIGPLRRRSRNRGAHT